VGSEIKVHSLDRGRLAFLVGGVEDEGVAVAASVAADPVDEAPVHTRHPVLGVDNVDAIAPPCLHAQLAPRVEGPKRARVPGS